MSIKKKLLCSYVSLILFSTLIFGLTIGLKSQKTISSNIQDKNNKISTLILDIVKTRNDLLSDKVSTDLQYANDILEDYGSLSLKESFDKSSNSQYTLYTDNKRLSDLSEYIDKVESVTGGVCSVFLFDNTNLVRILSNVPNSTGSINNNLLDENNPITKRITNGLPYYGVIKHDSHWYITGYVPLKDKDDKIIGALGVGHKQLNQYLRKMISDIVIGTNGYVYIMNSQGDVILHPNDEGKNLYHYDFSKEIIEEVNGSKIYTYGGQKKLATFTYFPTWDWYIVSTSNYNDINQPSISLIVTTFTIGFFVLILASIIAKIMADTIVKPISDLKYCMDQFSVGNRDIHHDSSNTDEIGVLSKTFNNLVRENNKLLTEIEKQSEIKSEFFSNVSHELKTPLNIISSANQLLELKFSMHDEFNTDEFKSLTSSIRHNSFRLLKLVNNLIDIPRLDSGNLKMTPLNVNAVEVVENVTQSTVNYVTSKERNIIFDTNTEEKIMAVDPDLLERIMLNLISNATKFTTPGDSIFVYFEDNEESISISVKDTGIGIPLDKQELVFKRFCQVDKLLNRNHEGSGIGLSLVSSIVKLHNGSITLKSEPDVGSEFIITLPVRIIPDEDVISYASFSSSEKTVEQANIEFSDIYS